MDLMSDAGFLMSRASAQAIRVTNAALVSEGLKVRPYSALSACFDLGGIAQRDLSELLGMDPSQVVALVDELEGAGLVKRSPDPADRRTRLVSATRRGGMVLRRARRLVEAAMDDFFEPLAEAERDQLRALLRKLVVDVREGDKADAEAAS